MGHCDLDHPSCVDIELPAFLKQPLKSWDLGNPKAYDTFVDEGLNLALRVSAESSHGATVHRTVYGCFAIMGRLKTNIHLFASPDNGCAQMDPPHGGRDRAEPGEVEDDGIEHGGRAQHCCHDPVMMWSSIVHCVVIRECLMVAERGQRGTL
eukprot:9477927-Pyramimonas_sp.AAC.6